jgi:hypothetical protein
MFITPNMGLTAWDLGTDPYNHSQLANNFAALDQHTHVPGQGKRIPTNGIEDLAITTAKIATNAVTADKIPDASLTQQEHAKPSIGNPELFDNAVSGTKIQDGTISARKLDSTVTFVGELRAWYRVNASVQPPVGWEVADGRPWSSVTNAMGPGGTQWNTGNMPDYRNKYILGAALTGTGSGSSTPPDIGMVIGSHTVNLTHTHTVAHSHNVLAHTHSIPDHTHGVFTDVAGAHGHTFGGGFIIHTRQNAFIQGIEVRDTSTFARSNSLESLYIAGIGSGGSGDQAIGVDAGGNHSHGGTTGTVFGSLTSGAGTSTTDVQTPTTSSGGSATQDIRPASIGALVLMRVI